MIKKLGIAAACGIAVYGLAKLIKRHVFVLPKMSAGLPSDATAGTGPNREAANDGNELGNIPGDAEAAQAMGEVASDGAAATSPGQVTEQQHGSAREEPCL